MRAKLKLEASPWQRVADHLAFPLNMWLSVEASARLGLTPIDHERVRAALPFCRGRLLDIGCGDNLLVRTYGNGFGVDVHPYAAAAALCDSSSLAFRSGSFDSAALLACLNHITRRLETLVECRRVLRPGGRLLVTIIPRWVGVVSHRIRKRHDPDQLERGMGHDEDPGLCDREVRELFVQARFRLVLHRRFMWGLNSIYVAEKER